MPVIKNVCDLLMAWGTSKRVDSPEGLGYSSSSAFVKKQNCPSFPPLNDDLHMAVDHIVSDLKGRNAHKHDILCAYYIYQQSDTKIARRISKSRSTVRDLRMSAEAWVEGRLHGLVDFPTVNR